MGAQFRIGTSGWHYRHWLGAFYPDRLPAARMLEYYSSRFDTVELNNTFYRLPTGSAVREWRDGSPGGFRFTAKGSRFITHMKKLKDPESGLEKYFAQVGQLGQKLEAILWQLPPFWECDADRLEAFLKALPGGYRHAFEFRNPTWHNPRVLALLERHNAAWCSWDLAGVQSPILLTADFAYVRLHGPAGAYAGTYSVDALRQWAERIRLWSHHLRIVFVFFDNDAAACAPHDALALKGLIE